MEITIKLGEKEYRLHSSLFTIIDYRNIFGSELFSDIKKLEKGKNIKLSLDGRDLDNELKESQSNLKNNKKTSKPSMRTSSTIVRMWNYEKQASKLNEILQTTKKKPEA